MGKISNIFNLKIIPFLERWNLINVILGIIDIIAIALAFEIAYLINYYEDGGRFFFERKEFTHIFLGLLPLWLLVLYLIKVTEIPRT